MRLVPGSTAPDHIALAVGESCEACGCQLKGLPATAPCPSCGSTVRRLPRRKGQAIGDTVDSRERKTKGGH